MVQNDVNGPREIIKSDIILLTPSPPNYKHKSLMLLMIDKKIQPSPHITV